MFWIKRMLGFSLVSWIFGKVLDRKIKSINETLDKIKKPWIVSGLMDLREGHKMDKIQKPLEKRILVIDDDRAMKSFVEKWMTGDFTVEQLYGIPDDLNVLKGYDAVVVDGLGIGNNRFKEGLDLLMAYDKPEGQAVVYYSGLGAYGREREALERRGVAVVTKGSNPEKLVLAIRFSKMKAVETAKEEKAEKVEKPKKAKWSKHANRRHKRRR